MYSILKCNVKKFNFKMRKNNYPHFIFCKESYYKYCIDVIVINKNRKKIERKNIIHRFICLWPSHPENSLKPISLSFEQKRTKFSRITMRDKHPFDSIVVVWKS